MTAGGTCRQIKSPSDGGCLRFRRGRRPCGIGDPFASRIFNQRPNSLSGRSIATYQQARDRVVYQVVNRCFVVAEVQHARTPNVTPQLYFNASGLTLLFHKRLDKIY